MSTTYLFKKMISDAFRTFVHCQTISNTDNENLQSYEKYLKSRSQKSTECIR